MTSGLYRRNIVMASCWYPCNEVTAYMVMDYVVMAYIFMVYIVYLAFITVHLHFAAIIATQKFDSHTPAHRHTHRHRCTPVPGCRHWAAINISYNIICDHYIWTQVLLDADIGRPCLCNCIGPTVFGRRCGQMQTLGRQKLQSRSMGSTSRTCRRRTTCTACG